MRIGEIAEAAGVTTSRIRFYERRGLVPPAARAANGYRDYPAELVTLLRFVELAQSLGFTLREIGGVRPSEGEHYVSCDEGIRLLTAKHESVTALIAEAEQRKTRIEATMAELEAVRANGGPHRARTSGQAKDRSRRTASVQRPA